MSNILRRALQLFGGKVKVKVRVNVDRGESEPIVAGEGWDSTVLKNIDLERLPDWHGHGDNRCPECQQKPVTCVWEMWENTLTENDFRHVDYFWCGNGHMWIATTSYHEQVLSGAWG